MVWSCVSTGKQMSSNEPCSKMGASKLLADSMWGVRHENKFGPHFQSAIL